MSTLSKSLVVQSATARTLFLVTAIVTVVILLCAFQLAYSTNRFGLSSIFHYLFVALDYRAAMAVLLILIAAALAPAGTSVRRFLLWLNDHVLAVAVATAVVLCLGTIAIYRSHPLCMDEYAAIFQSQVFAAGHIAGRFPTPLIDWLLPAHFQGFFFAVSRTTGEVVSLYWPSHALLLAPFTWLGIPWALNPLLSAFSVLAIHRLALRILGNEEASGLAVLLTIASPVFFANGISYYSMPAHLLANSIYALLLLQPTCRKAFVAGIVGSIALTLHNPVPHLLFALPWFVWTLTRPQGMRIFMFLCIGYVPLCLLLGVGWYWFYSQLMNDGVAMAGNEGIAGAQRFASAFSIPDVNIVIARLIGVAKVWLWAVPGLILLAFLGARRCRHDRRCQLLIISMVATFVGYLFVPVDQGHGWGFRYFHSAWFALPILAAAAFTSVSNEPKTARSETLASTGSLQFIVTCALLTMTLGIGLRSWQIRGFMSEHLAQAPTYSGDERHVEIISTQGSFYGADLIQNDPWLRGQAIRMISHGKRADAEMMHAHFPGMSRVYADRFGSIWSQAESAHKQDDFVQPPQP